MEMIDLCLLLETPNGLIAVLQIETCIQANSRDGSLLLCLIFLQPGDYDFVGDNLSRYILKVTRSRAQLLL